MSPKKRRGQPPKYIKDPEGKPVVGLSQDTSTGTYFYTFWRSEGIKSRPNFGTIYPDCILKYRQWQSRREGKTVELLESKGEVEIEGESDLDNLFGHSEIEVIIQPNGKTEVSKVWDIPQDIFIAKVREFLSDPINAAHLLGPGWEGVRRLNDLPKEEPPLTLDEVLNFYLDNRKPSKDEYRKCKDSWNVFCKSVRPKKTIQAISLEDVRKYYSQIYQEYQDKEYSAAWIKGRFARIKTILKYSIKRGIKSIDDLNRVFGYCNCLTVPSQETVGAKPISKDDFHKLLKIADTKFNAILLLSLNCGYYAKDIHDLKREHIQNKGIDFIVFPRQKTKLKRVNVLWGITKQAIDKYLKDNPIESEYLITNGIDSKPVAVRTIQKHFSELRKKATISPDVKFNNLRDGAATALFGKTPEDIQNVFLGHSIKGQKKKYIDVSPEIMQEAAEIVYKAYIEEQGNKS